MQCTLWTPTQLHFLSNSTNRGSIVKPAAAGLCSSSELASQAIPSPEITFAQIRAKEPKPLRACVPYSHRTMGSPWRAQLTHGESRRMSILLGSATILRLFCRTGPLFQWKSLSRTRSIVKSIERRGGAKLRLGLVFLRQLLVTWQVSSNQPRDRINFSSVPPLGPICPKQITTDYVRLALLGGNDPEEVLSTSIHVIFCSLLNKELTLSHQIIPPFLPVFT